jgi:hypothetical protein
MTTRSRAITITLATTLSLISFRLLLDSILSELQIDAIVRSAIYVGLIFILLSLGTLWVLFYKIDFKFLITGSLFPFLCFLPFWGVSESIINSFSEIVGISAATIVINLIFALVIYILILTVNILNGARLKSVPLGQAAKAAHFIFVLVASYFFFTYIFSSSLPILLSVCITLLYIGYMSLSSVANLELDVKEERIITLLITFMIGLVFLFISIWPIVSIYSALIMTIVYYLLLNVALELRESITKYIWLEYLLLLLLVIVILFANAVWGVNGTII